MSSAAMGEPKYDWPMAMISLSTTAHHSMNRSCFSESANLELPTTIKIGCAELVARCWLSGSSGKVVPSSARDQPTVVGRSGEEAGEPRTYVELSTRPGG